MRTLHPFALTAMLAATLSAACGKNDSPTGPSPVTAAPPAAAPPAASAPVAPAATYAGVFAGAGGANGSIELRTSQGVAAQSSIRTLATASASGFVTVAGTGGTRIDLTGTFDTVTGTFAVTGGGYSVNARVTGSAVSGTCRTPSGAECGVVATEVTSAASAPGQFCGPFNGAPQGRIVFVISGGRAVGFVSEAEGHVDFEAPVTGSSIAITAQVGPGHTGRAEGTLSGSTWSGTWSNTYGERGTWSASPGGCR